MLDYKSKRRKNLPIIEYNNDELATIFYYEIRKYAYKLRNIYCDVEDLIQEGMVGLLKGRRRLDPQKGGHFSFLLTYAKGEMLNFKRDHGHIMKIPRRASYEERRQLISITDSLDRPILTYTDSPELERSNRAVAETVAAPAEDWDAIVEATFVEELVNKLPGRERQVILYSLEGDSQQKMALKIGYSQMHISRIYRSAMEHLMEMTA